jgi:hypothetical protein
MKVRTARRAFQFLTVREGSLSPEQARDNTGFLHANVTLAGHVMSIHLLSFEYDSKLLWKYLFSSSNVLRLAADGKV